MASEEIVKGLLKPPFATYDIVVYFGCGLFALPFIQHYVIEPFGLHFPSFSFNINVPFAELGIATLSLLFSVYILGHIIAYVSSQIIERSMETVFGGKASSIIEFASATTPQNRNEQFRKRVRTSLRASLAPHALFTTMVRALAHFPVWAHYLAIYWLGVFGYYQTRVPPSIVATARARHQALKLKSPPEDDRWFKTIEAFVMNQNPIATARMYNYLIISGLFRSVSLIFLLGLWAEILLLLCWKVSGFSHPSFFMSSGGGFVRWLVGFCIMSAVYLFSLFAFLKFQRRYVEDTVFAYVVGLKDTVGA